MKDDEDLKAWPGYRQKAGERIIKGQAVHLGMDGKVYPWFALTGAYPMGAAVREIEKDEIVPFNPATGQLG